MALSKEELCERVRSTRTWLEKAEQDLRGRAPWQGELQLMLAQAEMQKLREERRGTMYDSRYWQRGAALVAATLLCAGLWWWQQPAEVPSAVNPPGSARETAALVPTETNEPVLAPVGEAVVPPAAAAVQTTEVTASPATQEEVAAAPVAPTAEPVTLSPRELQAAVADAAQILRKGR